MSIVLFEDAQVVRLWPITLSRPAYAVSCGSYRLIDLIGLLDRPVRAIVRPYLAALQAADFPQVDRPAGKTQSTVLVNARVVPSVSNLRTIRSLLDADRPGVVRSDDQLALAVLPAGATPPPAELSTEALLDYLSSLNLDQLATLDGSLPLLDYPHEVVRYHMATLQENLQHRLEHSQYEEIANGVFAGPGAKLGEFGVTDTRDGPIVLEQDADVGPYCFLSGPAHLGRGARVLEHAAIKDAVALGHTTKIGGEVEASIVEPYTNKQHHGFLGHSYLGSWINLGAGTCNSDLKNTYGPVRMDYGGDRVETGMQFIGCVVGDYSKTAINTGIFTGTTIGVCSMMYGFVTTNVASFVNYARSFGQVSELSPDVMIATQQRMFTRRNVQQRDCDQQLIYAMHALTRHERQLVDEPLAL